MLHPTSTLRLSFSWGRLSVKHSGAGMGGIQGPEAAPVSRGKRIPLSPTNTFPAVCGPTMRTPHWTATGSTNSKCTEPMVTPPLSILGSLSWWVQFNFAPLFHGAGGTGKVLYPLEGLVWKYLSGSKQQAAAAASSSGSKHAQKRKPDRRSGLVCAQKHFFDGWYLQVWS